MSILRQFIIELDQILQERDDHAQYAEWAIDRIRELELQVKAAESGPARPNRHKLTDHEVQDIRAAHRGGMKQKDLALNYGVNPATISRIVRGVYH